jgi:hypothetical protein
LNRSLYWQLISGCAALAALHSQSAWEALSDVSLPLEMFPVQATLAGGQVASEELLADGHLVQGQLSSDLIVVAETSAQY